MYTLLRLLPVRRLLQDQIPAFVSAFVIAELFYKFHSFSLETLAFLATWGVVDGLIQVVRQMITGKDATAIDNRRGH